ncbi:MAG: TonB-dependent receptor [Prevotellaceae bacterium]|jgi:TonB-linked SusC/RagA family outer membrane protein|nr:TonB-dependent receptor [Prevotellaceae bacterium]
MKRKLRRKISVDIKYIIKTGFLSLLAGLMSLSVFAQQGIKISGSVTDDSGELLSAVSVSIRGTTQGVMTDDRGEYSLTVPNDTTILVFSSVGYQTQEIKVGSRRIITAILREEAEDLGEVTIVAFGSQKKESVISAIQTINPQELRVPSSNLTTAFAGRIAGMISYQTSGEPGYDDASFFIRGITTFGAGKVDPLILVDNVEVTTSDLSKLHPDDIQAFSILKDATATALYGARGANGVILVTTKTGVEGRAKVSFRFENSFSSATKKVEMADPITYMRLANEAVSTRNPLGLPPYTEVQIANTANPNRNEFVYPAVDWMSMLTKDVASNQRANLNISGGGQIARYYIAGSISQDNGILKVDKRNNFNNNVDLKKYLIRSNININLTKTMEAIVRVHGTFEDYKGPITGGTDMYKKILQVSPVGFPPYFEPDDQRMGITHILFGGRDGSSYLNPYAELVKGYRQNSNNTMMAQLELKQDFGKLIKGLTARLLGNTSRYSAFTLNRAYNPYYYEVESYNRFTDKYTLTELNKGSEYLVYNAGDKTVNGSFYGEASLAYSNTFKEKHSVSGMLVGIMRNALTANAKTLSESLEQRNLGLSGRFTYGYGSRYFAEFNFGYNGSEKFDKGHRWGFFPSAGVGWNVSNEPFWTGKLKDIVSLLKFRGTYGLVGNDQFSNTRFFYLSEVQIGGGNSYRTGIDFNGYNYSGVKTVTYANPEVGWETSYKGNFGIELGLFKGKVEIQADFFREHRTNILQPRADIPTESGLWATPSVNVGEANGRGFDISVDYNHNIGKDAWLVGRANFTYAHSTYSYYEELDYAALGAPWRSRAGNPVSQQWGYKAEHLFIDEYEKENSPRQDFGEYIAGDIKYKDINNDDVINELDRIPIGYPTTPEINYGFGVSAGYKNFDVSVFFQGGGRYSFWISYDNMSPFYSRIPSGESKVHETGLAKFIADDYWSESSRNPNAAWPRLSPTLINNNRQGNTLFMRNGSFLRFKSAEIGYSLPNAWISKLKLSSLRLYLSGTNLLLFNGFKLWDVEMGGSGLGYPLQRVTNLGINISF